MLAATFLDRSVFMRELLPEDLKLEVDKISRDEALKAARYLAMVGVRENYVLPVVCPKCGAQMQKTIG
jgi:hypothetical protein